MIEYTVLRYFPAPPQHLTCSLKHVTVLDFKLLNPLLIRSVDKALMLVYKCSSHLINRFTERIKISSIIIVYSRSFPKFTV